MTEYDYPERSASTRTGLKPTKAEGRARPKTHGTRVSSDGLTAVAVVVGAERCLDQNTKYAAPPRANTAVGWVNMPNIR